MITIPFTKKTKKRSYVSTSYYTTIGGQKHRYKYYEPAEVYERKTRKAKEKRAAHYGFKLYPKPIPVSGKMTGAMRAGVTGHQYGKYHYLGRRDRVFGKIEEVAKKGHRGFHGGYVGSVVQPIISRRQEKPSRSWIATHKERDRKGRFK